MRKRELTAKSSSRWAGALTRTSEDAYQLACRNLLAERRSLAARIKRIDARLAVTAGTRAGRVHGYRTAAERHAKTIRIQTLRTRLAAVERQLGSGRVSVCRGGKALLRTRHNLAAGFTETQWRQRWAASRMFLTADGEKDKTWGNQTIRWNPDQNWLEIRLPTPLAHLANRPHGRYRLSCPARFSYRGSDVAAQAATGAIRYDISLNPARGRWYLHASWKTPAGPLTLPQARQGTVVAVDVNAGHLAVAVLDRDGNRAGVPYTISLPPPAVRDANAPATGPHADGGAGRSATRSRASPPPGSVTGSPAWPPTPAWPSSRSTRPTPPAGQRSTGSLPRGSTTPSCPATTRQRW